MRASIICFTEHGADLAEILLEGFAKEGLMAEGWIKKKDARKREGIRALTESLSLWTKEQFQEKELLVFIGAAGIAVRSIAPFVRSKKTDPAVLVIDEQGRHVISLLSGHMGGANRMTLLTASLLGAEPVITTATDLHGKFAVDSFAARRSLYLDSMEYAKEIASLLVEEKKVGMYSRFPVSGRIPEELIFLQKTEKEKMEYPVTGLSVDVRKDCPFAHTLHLVPRAVAVGIGCRRGTSQIQIEEAVREVFEEAGLFWESIGRIASIDLKKEEEGLVSFAERLKVPFLTYTSEELAETFCREEPAESEFVRQMTGVGNVCERSAVRASGNGELLIPKTIRNKVTVAAALTEYTVFMED